MTNAKPIRLVLEMSNGQTVELATGLSHLGESFDVSVKHDTEKTFDEVGRPVGRRIVKTVITLRPGDES